MINIICFLSLMFIYMCICEHECGYQLWNSKGYHEKNKSVVEESVWGDITKKTHMTKRRIKAINWRIEGDKKW